MVRSSRPLPLAFPTSAHPTGSSPRASPANPAAPMSSHHLTSKGSTSQHPAGHESPWCSLLCDLLHGPVQALALAARASRIPFNPCSLDLPSVGALVAFYHACLGFPIKQTWLDAIRAGNCDTFDGLTYSNAARYCPNADETIMGHLA
jgi:hypothetical protein